MEPTKAWWSKEFADSVICKYYGACFECCDFEKMTNEIEAFIALVEAKTIERCAGVAREETLSENIHPEDIAYNSACVHIAQAITKLNKGN